MKDSSEKIVRDPRLTKEEQLILYVGGGVIPLIIREPIEEMKVDGRKNK